MLEIADILREVGPACRSRFGSSLSSSQRRALRDIELCRTAALGGQLSRCDRCGTSEYSYHSCRNRHCPKCQGDRTERWLADWRPRLLPCSYFLLTFTLPSELRPVARDHQKVVYGALMRAAASALIKLAADSRHLGALPGLIAVLHTWTRDLRYHPHVHILVTAGGVDGEGTWVASRNPAFLLPCRVLSVLFRAKVRDALRHVGLGGDVPSSTWRRKWVVHCQHAGSGQKVLEYLGRYVHRVALPNSRLESFDGQHVVFRYRENGSGELRRCRLPALDFIGRFLQHVLPKGFVKVRAYGLYSSSSHESLDLVRQQLSDAATSQSAPPTPDELDAPTTDRLCPHCGSGHLRVVAELAPALLTNAPPSIRGPP